MTGELTKASGSFDLQPEETVGRVAFIAFSTFIFILMVSPQTFFPILGHLYIAKISIGVAVISTVATRSATGQKLFTVPRGSWPVIFLGVWAVMTTPFSDWPGGSVELFTELFAKSLIIAWLIPQIIDRSDRLRGLIAFMCILATPLALTALSNFVNGNYESTAGNVGRIVGFDAPLTGNPNDLALMLNILLPLTASLWMIYRSPGQRMLLAGLMALIVSAIVVTFSRAAFITMAVVWLAHAFRSMKGLKKLALPVALAVGLVGILTIPSGYSDRISTVSDISADTTRSSEMRWLEVKTAANVAIAQPLTGAGLGMDVLEISRADGGSNVRSVHDIYLQYAADLGFPGLIMFLVFIIGCLRASRKVARESRVPELAHLARGIELSIWVFVIEGAFHPAAYHFYAFLVGGLALAARAIHAEEAVA